MHVTCLLVCFDLFVAVSRVKMMWHDSASLPQDKLRSNGSTDPEDLLKVEIYMHTLDVTHVTEVHAYTVSARFSHWQCHVIIDLQRFYGKGWESSEVSNKKYAQNDCTSDLYSPCMEKAHLVCTGGSALYSAKSTHVTMHGKWSIFIQSSVGCTIFLWVLSAWGMSHNYPDCYVTHLLRGIAPKNEKKLTCRCGQWII